jgi:hypothetical protein
LTRAARLSPSYRGGGVCASRSSRSDCSKANPFDCAYDRVGRWADNSVDCSESLQ